MPGGDFVEFLILLSEYHSSESALMQVRFVFRTLFLCVLVFCSFFDFRNVCVLKRVTKGEVDQLFRQWLDTGVTEANRTMPLDPVPFTHSHFFFHTDMAAVRAIQEAL